MFRGERGPRNDMFKKKESGLKGDQANAAAARRKAESPKIEIKEKWEQPRAANLNRGVQPKVGGATDDDASTGKK